MRSASRTPVLSCLVLTLIALLPAPAPAADPVRWPQFRGEGARGVADDKPLPVKWNGERGEGIAWKAPIPGLGHSSPAIWGDRLFVTSAESDADKAGIKIGLYGDIDPVADDSVHRFVVTCLERKTGKVLWRRVAFEGKPHGKRHMKSTHANATAAVDGKRVVVSFGTEGLYAYSLDGELLWKKELGNLDTGYYQVPEAQWGYGASPVLHDGRVIVQADVLAGSYLAAFDANDGKELWRVKRDDVPTWSTPTVYDDGKRAEVLVNGYRHMGGYAFDTGEALWSMKGNGDIPVPTPYVVDGIIYYTSAHGPGAPIYAVRAGARGTIGPDENGETPQLAWSRNGGSYLPTSLVYRGAMYICRDNGVLIVLDAKSGEPLYQQRLGAGSAGFVASAVAGDGKVYLTSEEGTTHVVRAGKQFEELAANELGEIVLATPAIADGTLYFRTRDHVVAVRRPAAQ